VWQWGQFLAHDLSLTVQAEPAEPMNIEVPRGDPFFDPAGEGDRTIRFRRSSFRVDEGVREQVNSITAFIDASQVHGSDPERARAVRARDGSGRLATSAGELLPFNRTGLDNAPSPDPSFFLAGDVRANEQPCQKRTVMNAQLTYNHPMPPKLPSALPRRFASGSG